jgi:hypothetical protein
MQKTSVSRYKKTAKDYITDGLVGAMRGVGLYGGEGERYDRAHSITDALDWVTPVGVETSLNEGNALIQRGQTEKDPLKVLGGYGMVGASILPGAVPKLAKLGAKKGVGALKTAMRAVEDGADTMKALPKTKKAMREEAKAASIYQPLSQAPIASQAGRMGIPIGAEGQLAAQHTGVHGPYHNIKPKIDPSEYSATYEPMLDMGQRQTFDPAKLENSMVFPLYGDRSMAGQRIKSINGTDVDVPTYGGARYGEFNAAQGSPAAWASDGAVINKLREKIKPGLDQGLSVNGIYTAMGPASADQTTMMTDALFQQAMRGKIAKKDMAAFNAQASKIFPGFLGVDHPGAVDQLMKASQGARQKINALMDTAKYHGAGFPDVAATRMALTEPALRNVPAGASGYSVVNFGDDSLQHLEPKIVHPTYPVQMAGTPLGGMDQQIPHDLLYPDFYARRRDIGADPGSDLRALELGKPTQVIGARESDNIQEYLYRASKYRP